MHIAFKWVWVATITVYKDNAPEFLKCVFDSLESILAPQLEKIHRAIYFWYKL